MKIFGLNAFLIGRYRERAEAFYEGEPPPRHAPAVAYLMGHASGGFWPILNGGELAIAYSWISLYLAAQGPGAWALDNRHEAGHHDSPAHPEGTPRALRSY